MLCERVQQLSKESQALATTWTGFPTRILQGITISELKSGRAEALPI